MYERKKGRRKIIVNKMGIKRNYGECFFDCQFLKTVYCGTKVDKIGTHAFFGCTELIVGKMGECMAG